MIRHIVSWNFKPETDAPTRHSVAQQIMASGPIMTQQIDCVLQCAFYCPPLDGSTCDIALYLELDEAEHMPIYQNHPTHLPIVALIKAHCCERHCIDIPV